MSAIIRNFIDDTLDSVYIIVIADVINSFVSTATTISGIC